MYYFVKSACRFDGVAYQPGDVIDLADPEIATRLLREVGRAVVLTDDPRPVVVQVVVEAAPEPVAPVAPIKPVKAKRSKK